MLVAQNDFFVTFQGKIGINHVKCGTTYEINQDRRRLPTGGESLVIEFQIESNDTHEMELVREIVSNIENAPKVDAEIPELSVMGVNVQFVSISEEKGNGERLISPMPSNAPIKRNASLTDDQLRDAKDKAKELMNTANESAMMKKAKNKSGLGGGAIAGIVISAIIAVACCGVVIFRFLCNKSSSGYKKRRVYYSSSEISSDSSETSDSSSSSSAEYF